MPLKDVQHHVLSGGEATVNMLVNSHDRNHMVYTLAIRSPTHFHELYYGHEMVLFQDVVQGQLQP